MKLTEHQLKQIIKEQLATLMREQESHPAWMTVASAVHAGWMEDQESDKMGSRHTDLADWLGPNPEDIVDRYIAAYMDDLGMPDDLSTTSPEMSELSKVVVDELLGGWQPEE